MVKGFEDAYVAGDKPFTLEYKGETKKFIARELGYLAIQNIAARAAKFGLNGAALLVSESIESENGEKFTYEEVQRLKKDVAKILWDAAHGANPLDVPEKK